MQELLSLTNKILDSLLIRFNGVWWLPPKWSKLPWMLQICRFYFFPDCSSSKLYRGKPRGVNICLLLNFKLLFNIFSMAAVAIILDNCFAFKLILNELFYLCQMYIIMYNSDVMNPACFLSNYNENSFLFVVIVFRGRCPQISIWKMYELKK